MFVCLSQMETQTHHVEKKMEKRLFSKTQQMSPSFWLDSASPVEHNV
jgi:hypothetical protein